MSKGNSVTSMSDQHPSGRRVFSVSIKGVWLVSSMFAAWRGGVVVMTMSKFWGDSVLSQTICQAFPPSLRRNAVTGTFSAIFWP